MSTHDDQIQAEEANELAKLKKLLRKFFAKQNMMVKIIREDKIAPRWLVNELNTLTLEVDEAIKED